MIFITGIGFLKISDVGLENFLTRAPLAFSIPLFLFSLVLTGKSYLQVKKKLSEKHIDETTFLSMKLSEQKDLVGKFEIY